MSWTEAITFDLTGQLLLLLGRIALLLGLAWLSTKLARRASAALRHGIWTMAVLAVLLVPLLSPLVPELGIPLPQLPAPPSAPVKVIGSRFDAVEMTPQTDARQATSAPAPAADTSRHLSVPEIMLVIWALIGFALLLQLFAQLYHFRRIELRARHDQTTEQAQLMQELARRMGIRRPIRLLWLEHGGMPVTWGIRHPAILLPLEAKSWPQERLYVVLVHELAHIRRYDYISVLLAEVACVIYWILPLTWLARHRLKAEQERACDDRVVAFGVDHLVYAEHLLEIARTFRNARRGTGVLPAMAREVSLKQRVFALLGPAPTRKPLGWKAGGALLVVGFLAAVLVASLAPGRKEPAVSPLPLEEILIPGPPARTASAIRTIQEAAIRPHHQWIEAERGRARGDFERHDDSRASGRYYFQAGDDDGTLRIPFEVPAAGEYVIWGRVRSDDEDENSFYARIDDTGEIIWDVPDLEETAREWTWDALAARGTTRKVFRLDSGRHYLTLRTREDDTRIDGILVTSDLAFRPVGFLATTPGRTRQVVEIEAERGTLENPFQVNTDDEVTFILAHERKSMDTPPERGHVTYRFRVRESGLYSIWARTLARSDAHNSFWLRLDSGPWIRWNSIDDGKRWRWGQVRDSDKRNSLINLDLKRGSHLLTLAYREADTRLDRLVVTNDPDFRPDHDD